MCGDAKGGKAEGYFCFTQIRGNQCDYRVVTEKKMGVISLGEIRGR